MAAYTQGGAQKRRSVATTGFLLLKGPQARRCRFKAVHTQRGAHKRRFAATARGLLFKGGAGVSPASSEASQS